MHPPQVGKRLDDDLQLPLQMPDLLEAFLGREMQPRGRRITVLDFNHWCDLGKCEPKSLRTEDAADTVQLDWAVHAYASIPARRDQSTRLVEPERPQGNAAQARDFGARQIGRIHARDARLRCRGDSWIVRSIVIKNVPHRDTLYSARGRKRLEKRSPTIFTISHCLAIVSAQKGWHRTALKKVQGVPPRSPKWGR
jgi:hypothetical protein